MSLSIIETPKPWSVSEFQLYRPYITNFVDKNIVNLLENPENEIRRILVHGEVKSGKREIVEYSAKRDEGSSQRIHLFMSSFHRVADEDQRKELAKHNIKVFSIKNKDDVDNAIKVIRELLRDGKQIVIHLDECDYGTGSRQNLKKIYGLFKENKSIVTILYSATPEELLFSQDITQSEEDDKFIEEIYEEGLRLYYIPPYNYCGAKKFLEEGLVHEAKPFFEKTTSGALELSSQAKEIINDAKVNIEDNILIREEYNYLSNKAKREGRQEEYFEYKKKASNIKIKNVIELRFTYKTFGPTNLRNGARSIEAFVKNKHLFEELDDCIIILDKADYKTSDVLDGITIEQVQWSNKNYWDSKIDNKLIIVIHEQTSTRSTEWSFHDRLFATHDYRPNISYGTIAQAQLRVAHYFGKRYSEFQKIRVYGHLKTFQLAAKMISVLDYLNENWKKVPAKKDLFTIDEKVKFKYEGNWYDAKIVSYDAENKKYNLHFNMNSKLYKALDIGKGDIKSIKESKKFWIKNYTDNTNHPVYNEEYNEETADKIIEELGCNIKTELSSRVKGKSKSILKIKSEFIECDETNVREIILEKIINNNSLPLDVRNHNFNTTSLFNNYEFNEVGEKIYKGIIRSQKSVYKYEFMKDQRWGFNEENRKPRLTVCYDVEKLGVCLRYTNGEKEEVTTLSSYLSMYQPLK
jgi:antitoxin component of RelBE/YafQ-DinJ toxin-antitoxin module